ncbi:MAG: TatD family hydrolase [Tepidisphaerales bacterium]
MPLIDAHLHLADPAFEDDLAAILAAARAAGVCHFVVNSTGPGDWERVSQIARDHAGVIPCFGVHPWFVNSVPPAPPAESTVPDSAGEDTGGTGDWLDQLEHRLRQQPSAVGEIGIDRWIEPRDEALQQEVFLAQLDLARKLHRPAMIHCLRAWGWLMDLLKAQPPLPAGILIHAYGGPVELIEPLVRHNAYLSFAGNIFEARRHAARAAAVAVPLDRLLVETDAPDMLPPPEYRATVHRHDNEDRNHPANLPRILRGIAQLRGQSPDELAAAVFANARRLFGSLLP